MPSQISAQELSALFLELYDGPLSESNISRLLNNPDLDRKLVLSSIPKPHQPSHRPLHLLYVLLSEFPGPWPSFEVIKCHTRVLQYLPESAKTGSQGDVSKLLKAASKLVKSSYKSFGDFLWSEARPALRTTSSQSYITHQGLRNYVSKFRLPVGNDQRKPRVAIALPNGPLLAATCIAVTTYYTAAPINPAAGPEQFRADVTQAGAKFILTTPDDYEKLQLRAWANNDGIEVIFVDWDQGDEIALRSPEGQPIVCPDAKRKPNKADDIGIILFTSGTSGTKKVVPLLLHSIIAGIVFVIESWGLSEADVCLNMMPLYHVGGLVRNIFAPMFSGGCTVCCTAFDPNMFWDVIEELHPTWYYASPSMHSVILAEASSRPQSLQNNNCIRLACNAAGGLLPSLACQLRDTFNCVVLPSYGMTECMPISTPPLDYKLDREGTSGISTGPEITILDWSEKQVSCGTVGRICVRGEPVFPGYLRPDGTFDKSPFNKTGWFDSGDLGYMDEDGYLYITGRSKEVINRGGELISPFEVENAILSAAMSPNTSISGRVSQVLAFSATHDVLQEVVAVALVTPSQTQRVDLKTLHAALRSSLQQVKWPVLITYMDDLPKKNNKVLRIKLGQRLGLPDVTDEMSYLSRHWEAKCPPTDTALQVAIPSSPCRIDYSAVSKSLAEAVPAYLRHHYCHGFEKGVISLFIAPSRNGMPPLRAHLVEEIRNRMSWTLDNYLVPDQIHLLQQPFITDSNGEVDEIHLRMALKELQAASDEKLGASTEGRVTKAFADILSCHPDDVPPNVDFFSLGGDSLRAGRLVSILRSTFHCPLSINIVFNLGTVKAIAAHIDDVAEDVSTDDSTPVGCSETKSSRNPFLMLLQLFPLMVLYPVRRALQWTIFLVAFTYTQDWPTNNYLVGRLLNLTLAISFGRIVVRFFAPFVGIIAKWVIIGRFREGLYPMWGLYHTRWWLVEKIQGICGKGFFGSTDATNRLYYRLMGARIGKGVKLSGASLGEYDLLDIREGATLQRCVCRPFAAEGNTSMYLGRIIIGKNCSVGISSIIAAGSVIPPNTCIGPNSSSWETEDADEANRTLNPNSGPKPHWLLTCLFTLPLSLITWFASLLPWFGGLIGMVLYQPEETGEGPIRAILQWFTTPNRIGYHYLALVLRSMFAPFIFFIITIFVKSILDLLFGKLQPGSAANRGAIETWRAALIKTLLPVPRLHDMTSMFGQHYEATSVAVRMLGGKIGKRVYWPGTGPSIGDYHLLNIGNDVVFGSRAHLITSDGTSSDKITIGDRAMIADRVTLLPGVEIGERTTMGSGALTRRGNFYASDGVFVGSKGGDAVCLSTGRDKVVDDEKPSRCPTLRHNPSGSEVTLTSFDDEKHPPKKQPRTQIKHMSSDETLIRFGNRSRKSSMRRPYLVSPESVSDHSEYRSSELSNDASPFGRAFYMGQAPYHVMGPFAIFCYSAFFTVFTAFYWNVPNISAIQVVYYVIHNFLPQGINIWYDVLALWLLVTVLIATLTTLQAVLALAFVIAAKWALLGRRKPGNYDWDKSPYCQRWQLFLCIEKLRRQCYRGHGVLGMLTGTHWIVLYFKALGADIGKDCALFANGRPSLMFTEPDLIKLGDRVVVDDASVVAHINTRGKFDLNRLEIGNRCVLRSGSRLLSGATMKDDACLLEHTLIMGGDVVEAKWTMQGWPAERFTGQRVI